PPSPTASRHSHHAPPRGRPGRRPPPPPRPPPASGGHPRGNLVQRHRQLLASGLIGHYSQHRRSFLAGVAPPAPSRWAQEGRYAALEQMADPQVQVIPP